MAKPSTGDGELLVHLDVAGLAALMKAIEAAMTDGRGHLTLASGGGTIVSRSGSSDRFDKVTVTFADPAGLRDDAWRSGHPDPEPGLPILAVQD